MTAKKTYEKPSMKVVPLRQKPRLMVGSDTVSATMAGSWDDTDIVNATMTGIWDETDI